jgi:hypothetical protein
VDRRERAAPAGDRQSPRRGRGVGSAAPDSLLIRREGLLASVAPASPQRSLFNFGHVEMWELRR